MARMVVSSYPRSPNISRAVSKINDRVSSALLATSPDSLVSDFLCKGLFCKIDPFLSHLIHPFPESVSQARHLDHEPARQRRQLRRAKSNRPAAILAQRPKAHQPAFRPAVIIPLVANDRKLFERRRVIQ